MSEDLFPSSQSLIEEIKEDDVEEVEVEEEVEEEAKINPTLISGAMRILMEGLKVPSKKQVIAT